MQVFFALSWCGGIKRKIESEKKLKVFLQQIDIDDELNVKANIQ